MKWVYNGSITNVDYDVIDVLVMVTVASKLMVNVACGQYLQMLLK